MWGYLAYSWLKSYWKCKVWEVVYFSGSCKFRSIKFRVFLGSLFALPHLLYVFQLSASAFTYFSIYFCCLKLQNPSLSFQGRFPRLFSLPALLRVLNHTVAAYHCFSVTGCWCWLLFMPTAGCFVYIWIGRLPHLGCLTGDLLCCYVVMLSSHPDCPSALAFNTGFVSCHSPGHCSWSSAWLC